MNGQELMNVPGMAEVAAAGEVAPLRPELLASLQAAAADAVRGAQAQASVDRLAAARTRRGKRRLVLPAAAAAAITAGLLASVLVDGPQAGRTSAVPTPVRATQSIGDAADAAVFLDGVAQVQGAEPPSAAPYWRMVVAQTHAGAAPVTYTEWLGRAGAYFIVNGSEHRKQFTATWGVGPSSVDWEGLDRLPTDTDALRKLLAADGSGRAFGQIALLLGESPAEPALRAALYRVLAQLPRVQLEGPAKDSVGRTGTAVAFPTGDVTERLVIDPKTGLLLERMEIARTAGAADPACRISPGNPGHCRPALHVGEVIDSNTYLQVGPATSLK
ncbi:CU044_5270 family protein [Streptacidiphilus sp. N1-10]|uniref:CU044_5270 family protein n=1 Tax=Streptacidiphilus jeojiensis TaxID=3229225 RepID=A0ABV6XX55_9ACTN